MQTSQTKRAASKGDQLYAWQVKTKRNRHTGAYVIAMTAQEAIATARAHDKTWAKYAEHTFTAEPVRLATPVEIKRYNDEIAAAKNPGEQTSGPQWEVYNRDTGESFHKFANPENNNQSAVTIGLAWLEAQDNVFELRRHPLGVRPVKQSTTSPPVNTEPQNFPAARSSGGEWTGQWEVRSGTTGEVLYAFGGIGNSQADANRVARDWIQRVGHNGEVDVVPQMM